MVYTPIPIGSLNWGAPVNNAFTSQDARITNLEQEGGTGLDALGFVVTNYDPLSTSSSSPLTTGTISMIRLDLTAPATLTTSTISLMTAGAALTAGQNLVGLYTPAGTLVAQTADQSAAWTTTGEKNAAFTVPYAAPIGPIYLALLSVGGTPIGPVRTPFTATNTVTINHGLTAATARWATGPTLQTSLPASITMSSRTLSPQAVWAGLS